MTVNFIIINRKNLKEVLKEVLLSCFFHTINPKRFLESIKTNLAMKGASDLVTLIFIHKIGYFQQFCLTIYILCKMFFSHRVNLLPINIF